MPYTELCNKSSLHMYVGLLLYFLFYLDGQFDYLVPITFVSFNIILY